MRNGTAGQGCRGEEDTASTNPGVQDTERTDHAEPLIGRAHAGEDEARRIRDLLKWADTGVNPESCGS